ncbi:hypothetical protein H0H92_011962, partial [Tricholoma furcatifolium]
MTPSSSGAERGLRVDTAAAPSPATLDGQDRDSLEKNMGTHPNNNVIHMMVTAAYALSAPIATALIGGGPATMIWGWLLVAVLTQPIALSLAEICSVYPTSAGAYYWCFRLAPPKCRLLLSWINGWLYLVVTSMAEEVRHPAIEVPQAIVYSIPIGTVMGFCFLLPIVFTLPDIATLLNGIPFPLHDVPGGQPVGVMFTLIMGSRSGGFAMWFI